MALIKNLTYLLYMTNINISILPAFSDKPGLDGSSVWFSSSSCSVREHLGISGIGFYEPNNNIKSLNESQY